VLTKINKIIKSKKENELDIKENINAILSLPITWIDLSLFIIKLASEYNYNISGVDYIHIASMEVNSIKEIISADMELDKVHTISRIDPLKYS
jgi:predicted nucleic acid-binding protein